MQTSFTEPPNTVAPKGWKKDPTSLVLMLILVTFGINANSNTGIGYILY